MFSLKFFNKMKKQELKYNFVENNPDDEWDDLYEFQKKYIIENKISAKELLRALNAPITMNIYMHSKAFYPSLEENTNGFKLRKSLISKITLLF